MEGREEERRTAAVNGRILTVDRVGQRVSRLCNNGYGGCSNCVAWVVRCEVVHGGSSERRDNRGCIRTPRTLRSHGLLSSVVC